MSQLIAGVALLRSDPLRERLPIVMINDAGKRQNLTLNGEAVGMTVHIVGGLALPEEHGARWVQRAPEWPPLAAINETRRKAGDILWRPQRPQFVNKRLAQLIIGIE